MRKVNSVLFLASIALLLSVPLVAYAALGVHNITTGASAEGACANCHNTSATAATRGWGIVKAGTPTTGWYTQAITPLCWTCHSSGNGVGANDVTGTAMDSSNHSYAISGIPPTPLAPKVHDNAAVVASNLPYTKGAALQCTSCHNVHNDQFRPYLMKTTMLGLCDTCHPGRNTTAVRVLNIGVGTDNVSVHPVNISMDPGSLPVSMKTVANMDPAFKTAVAPATPWALGGKLAAGSTGNVVCQTCHAVHGKAGAVGINDLLAIDNKSADVTAVSSLLCEGCHYGGAATGSVGTTAGDHPLDATQGRAFYPTGVALPIVWTQADSRLDRGASVFRTTGVTGTPRCSSCHDAHGGLGTKSLLRSPIPTAANGEWCFSCHTSSQVVPKLHHSVKTTYAASAIICNDCHGVKATNQTQWNAHNGFGSFVIGPDTDGVAPAAGAGTLSTVATNAANFENLCEYCHVVNNPTTFVAARGFGSISLPARHGVTTGTMTHLASQYGISAYIQDRDRTYNSYLRSGTAGTNTAYWGTVNANATPYNGQEIFSKYANHGTGGTPQNPLTKVSGAYMICESCHNLITNSGVPATTFDATQGYMANLLLYPYQDSGSGIKSKTDGGGLCRGCHSTNAIQAANLAAPVVADSYVHYPEAHTSSHFASTPYAYSTTPYGRTTAAILTDLAGTCPEKTTADKATPEAPGVFSYPAAGKLDCDSCHRPHNADAEGDNGLDFNTANQNTVERYILEDGSVTTRNLAKTQACTQCHDEQVQCGY